MYSPVVHVGRTTPSGPDWEELGEPKPLSIKHGERLCLIMSGDPTVLLLARGHVSENTGRYVKNDEPIQLPDGIRGKVCKFIELNLDGTDTLCVFVMADDMQTCLVYDWHTCDCYTYRPMQNPLPANAILDHVVGIDANTMEFTYYIGDEPTTITVHLE